MTHRRIRTLLVSTLKVVLILLGVLWWMIYVVGNAAEAGSRATLLRVCALITGGLILTIGAFILSLMLRMLMEEMGWHLSSLTHFLPERWREEWIGDFYEARSQWQQPQQGFSRLSIRMRALGWVIQLVVGLVRCKFYDAVFAKYYEKS